MNFKRILTISMLCIFSCAFLSSCASIVHGRRQNVSVTSNPPGATVSDGTKSWTTPANISLERKRDHILTFSKDGYESQSIVINHVLSGAVAGNLILGGPIGWGVDAISGAQYRLIPETVNVEMKSLLQREVAKAVDAKSKDLKDPKNL